ncbi:transmembrane protein adipocyte-associated 1 homolog [Babylonia areolata]|uniref:transmembrane protein adipocyte-associated 1 homolog n=1 Tax=Babylonia areolata TaxID=304850 RepID=UPI003FD3AAE9
MTQSSFLEEFTMPLEGDFAGSNTSLITYSDEMIEGVDVKPNSTKPFGKITQPLCQLILYWDINDSRVRVWDMLILVPNTLFMAFLLGRLRPNIRRLCTSTSPMFSAIYGLVCVVSVISVLRCVVSMTVNASLEAGNIADKMLWLILRFFLLSTEASVITFGFYFGYLESRTSIQRVLACTSFFALGYSAVQCTMELKYEHEAYSVTHAGNTTDDNFDLFAHGGMIFLSTSSAAFCLVYFIILILPLTKIKEKIVLPSKRSFYYYVGILAVLNLVQAVGSLLLYQRVEHALCVVDATTYLYFTFFDPLIYGTFLWKFFKPGSRQSGTLLFSYSHQEDDNLGQHDPTHQHHHRHSSSYAVTGGDNDDGNNSTGMTIDHRPKFSNDSMAASPPFRLPTPFLSINQAD